MTDEVVKPWRPDAQTLEDLAAQMASPAGRALTEWASREDAESSTFRIETRYSDAGLESVSIPTERNAPANEGAEPEGSTSGTPDYDDSNARQWRPLFSERLAMEHMGPVHRRLHVAFSRLHYRVGLALWPDFDRAPSPLFRPWSWLWRQYRKTWRLRA